MLWKLTRVNGNTEEWSYTYEDDGCFETRSVRIPAHISRGAKEAIIEALSNNNSNLSALTIYSKV